ncbi:MAG: hypothetical protein AAGG56_14120 [Pseudomonadota bacterium]
MSRSLLISGVVTVCPTPQIRIAADQSATAVLGANRRNGARVAAVSADVASAVVAAVSGSTTFKGERKEANVAATVAAFAAEFSADTTATAAGAEVWEVVRSDCVALAEGTSLERAPLWPDGNPLQEDWDRAKKELESAGPEWDFWIDWYEKVLAGAPQDWQGLLTDVALIPPEDWDQGSAHVGRIIKGLKLKHALLATPNAEVVSFNADTQAFRVDPISEMPRDHLEEATERLANVLDLFDFEGDRSNQYRALSTEHSIIAQAVETYAQRPRMLHRACIRVLKRLDIKIRNGECPDRDSDADIDDFYGTVLAVSVDLFERDPLVREAATRAASARLRDIPPEQAEVLVRAADEVAAVSEGVLAEELPEDARVAVDPGAPDGDRKDATYVTASRLLRVGLLLRAYSGGKAFLQEVESLTKTVAGISGNVTKIAATGAGLSLPLWLDEALKIIVGLF